MNAKQSSQRKRTLAVNRKDDEGKLIHIRGDDFKHAYIDHSLKSTLQALRPNAPKAIEY
jgi:hypothetical protein